MTGETWLAARFEAERRRLHAVAYRMLGSRSEAEDAVQEAWLRLERAEADRIDNLGGWLTTVVARVCLDMLRSRAARREEPLEAPAAAELAARAIAQDPQDEALMADSVGLALIVVLDRLGPAERLAFVLHDLFAMPFEEIAPILGRSVQATRQLASRARRRVRGGVPQSAAADLARQRRVVDAFLAALRSRDFQGLLAVLDPDVVVRVDPAAARPGAPLELRGAHAWARGAIGFAGAARDTRAVLIDGAVGLAWAPAGRLRRVLNLTIEGERITRIEVIADPRRLARLRLALLDAPPGAITGA